MEKLHKYCLSVLLVIICSNISAQINNGNVENEDCKQLYKLYSQVLNYNCESSQELSAQGNLRRNLTIGQKQNAIDLIGKIFYEKQQYRSCYDKNGADFSEKERHGVLLKNFERNKKENLLTFISYFKTKVSKVRNKDYLDNIG